MRLEVFYTLRAKETLAFVYNYINQTFGLKSADRFLSKIDKTIGLIAENPLMFRSSSFDKTIRIALISKQTSLFYRVADNSIHLLFFWDNRQEPFVTL